MKYSEIPTKISGIYKIIFPNGKIYIGRAINIKRRIWEHYAKKDATVCYKALHKYFKSYNEIQIEILETFDENNYSNIYEAERKWIIFLNAIDKNIGYNITDGGDGGGIGIYNSASKFSQEDVNNIKKLLEEKRTNVYISQIYGVHPDTIGKINQGKTYFEESRTYPIRKEKGIVDYKDKYNSLTEYQIDTILYLLANSSLTNQQIADEVGCSASTIIKFNTGKHPYCQKIDLDFPLRKTRRTVKLTKEEIQEIKLQLLNSDLSIQDIAKNFCCSRDTISDINNGKRYFDKNENYPIRNFYPKRGSKKPVSTILGSEE